MYTTLLLIPREHYEPFTSASPLSLFYYVYKYGEWALDGKLVFIDEVESSKTAEPMLRSLTGQTDVTPRHLSVHEADLLDLTIKGKRSVWFTSVKTFGTEQIKNRFIHVNPNESIEQDDKVWSLQDQTWREDKDPVTVYPETILTAQAIFANIAENTAENKVKIPFEILWPYKQRRWLYPTFIMFIRAITRTNYKKRRTEDDTLIADKEDFNEARRLWTKLGKTLVYRVSQSAQEILEILPSTPEEAMTHVEISRQLPLSTRRIQELCAEMVDEGLVNHRKRESSDRGGRGAYEYWKATIPTPEEIKLKEETLS